jgi:hypothetical protein
MNKVTTEEVYYKLHSETEQYLKKFGNTAIILNFTTIKGKAIPIRGHGGP